MLVFTDEGWVTANVIRVASHHVYQPPCEIYVRQMQATGQSTLAIASPQREEEIAKGVLMQWQLILMLLIPFLELQVVVTGAV